LVKAESRLELVGLGPDRINIGISWSCSRLELAGLGSDWVKIGKLLLVKTESRLE
jgi:hypothetical protein